MYKLRFYNELGNLDKEEFFFSPLEMVERYKEVFVKYSPINPTAWYRYDSMDEWIRLKGF